MIKALTAVTFAALIAAALTLLPGFAPTVEASVPQALAKSDRLDIKTIGGDLPQAPAAHFYAPPMPPAGTQADLPVPRPLTPPPPPQGPRRCAVTNDRLKPT